MRNYFYPCLINYIHISFPTQVLDKEISNKKKENDMRVFFIINGEESEKKI